MKPFNLEEALKGKRVVTRNGKEVKDLYYFSKITASIYTVYADVEGVIIAFSNKGRYVVDSASSTLDLFMAPDNLQGFENGRTCLFKNKKDYRGVLARIDLSQFSAGEGL